MGRLPGSIRARLWLLIVLVLVPMLLLQGWIYLDRYAIRRYQALQTELEVARGVATSFATYLDDIRRLNATVGEAILTFDRYTDQKATRLLAAAALRYPTLRGMNWVDPQGRVLASSQPQLVGRSFADRSYFRQIVAGEGTVVGDLLPEGIDDGGPLFVIASALRDDSGNLLGVVVAGIEPTRLGELILAAERPAGGAYALFDRQGTVVFHSRQAWLSWEARRQWRESDSLLQPSLQTGREQVGQVRLQVPGGEWFSARVPVADWGWVAGAGRPVAIALAPLRSRLRHDAALVLFIASAAFLLAWHVARSIAGPLQQLESDAREMGEGNPGRPDQPGAPLEVRRLRATVAAMAAGLIEGSQALRRSQERIARTESFALVMSLHVSLDGRWLKVPPTFCRFLGYPEEELVGRPLRDVTHPDDFQPDWDQVQRLLRGEIQSFGMEKRFLRSDGKAVWGDINCSVVTDEAGRPVHLLTYVRDIDARKQAEEEVRRLNTELERRVEERTERLTAVNRELEAFTYTVSHDLRAPLRHLTGFADLLQEQAGDCLGERERHYLQTIVEAAQRMGRLVDDLLAFSRLERTALQRSRVDLRKLLEEVRQELAPDLAGRDIEWQIDELPVVPGDSGLLRTVLLNLLGNAVKYTRERHPARITVGCRQQEGETVCWVRDNGAGFDMRFADRLFGAFQRLHPAGQFEGTGVGLASVRRIIARHGGRTWAEGEAGRGASFYFSLPTEAPSDRAEG